MQIVTELYPVVKSAQAQSAERNLGMTVYAVGMPLEVCGTPDMRFGWIAAWHGEAMAELAMSSDPALAQWQADGSPRCGCSWNGDYSSVLPQEQRYGYIGE
jgi:hypothetical protein